MGQANSTDWAKSTSDTLRIVMTVIFMFVSIFLGMEFCMMMQSWSAGILVILVGITDFFVIWGSNRPKITGCEMALLTLYWVLFSATMVIIHTLALDHILGDLIGPTLGTPILLASLLFLARLYLVGRISFLRAGRIL